MVDVVKKIVDFMTSSIFETDEEYENRLLNEELNKKIKSLRRYNKHDLIENKIKPFLIEEFYRQNLIYPTDKQLNRMAMNAFNQGKDLGYIDCLNRRINE